jgi:hypothetical protein
VGVGAVPDGSEGSTATESTLSASCVPGHTKDEGRRKAATIAVEHRNSTLTQTPPCRHEIENARLADSLAPTGRWRPRASSKSRHRAPGGTHAAVRAKAPDTRAEPSDPVSLRTGGQADRRLNKALQLTRLIPSPATSPGCCSMPLWCGTTQGVVRLAAELCSLSRFVGNTRDRVEADRAARCSEGPSSRLPPAQRTYGARRGFAVDLLRRPANPLSSSTRDSHDPTARERRERQHHASPQQHLAGLLSRPREPHSNRCLIYILGRLLSYQ